MKIGNVYDEHTRVAEKLTLVAENALDMVLLRELAALSPEERLRRLMGVPDGEEGSCLAETAGRTSD